MFNPARAIDSRHISFQRIVLACMLAIVMAFGISGTVADASPHDAFDPAMQRDQNVDWMTAETATSLNIGMDVLVPSWIPEPFSGVAPSVSASNGYYRLYWMIDGASPTFLYVEGIAGGGFPAGSPADLNKELTINASVQGWSAIHDIGIPAGSDTPIYDQVWWIANGVLYTVSSNNMTGTDSLSLANSLVVLSVPQAPAPTEPPYVPPVEEAPVWEEPAEVPQDQALPVEEAPAEVVDDSASTDATDAVSEPIVAPTVDVGVDPDGSGPVTTEDETAPGPDTSDVGGQTSGGPWSPGRSDGDVPSDGTSGPPPPVIGGDGTGGLYDTALPRIRYLP